MDDEKKAWTLLGAIPCIGLILALTLPWGFTYIEYDEWAFKKNSLANEVDKSQVYESGRYFWGWAGTAVKFPNTYQFVSFTGSEALAIFTEDGLSVEIEASFQYRLVKDELKPLYEKFSNQYHEQIKSVAKAKIKNAITKFDLEKMVTDREVISSAIWDELAKDVRTKAHADVPKSKFQLRKMTLPPQNADKYLDSAVQQQDNKKQERQRQADIIRKKTEVLEKAYDANVTRILDKAKSTAAAMINTATYEARAIVAKAEGEGYATLFKTLGIESDVDLQQKYLRIDAILEGEVKPQMLFGLNTATVMLNSGAA